MKKTVVLTALLLAVTAVTPAGATRTMISEQPDENPMQLYTLKVFNADKSRVLYYGEAVSDSDKSVCFDFELNEKSGTYPYCIKSETGRSIEGSLSYVNDGEFEIAKAKLAEAIALTDTAQRTAAVEAVLKEYYNEFKLGENFEIDSQIKLLDTDAAYARIASLLTTDFTEGTVQQVYRESMVLAAAEFGTDSLRCEIAENYRKLAGFTDETINGEYAELTAQQQLSTAAREKGVYDSISDYALAHNRAAAIEVFNSCTTWQALGEKITKLNRPAEMGFDVTSNKNSVVQKLSAKMPFDSKADFDAKLQKAISEAGKTGSGGSSKTTGGSGGGSFGVDLSGGKKTPDNSSLQEFADMAGYEWAQPAVAYLVKKGAVNGRSKTEFAPGDSITREEFTKILTAAFGISGSADIPFSDVAENAWYRSFVEAAYRAGIVNGIGGGLFGTGRNITRQDAAAMIVRAAEYSGMKFESDDCDMFADKDSISDYAKSAVGKLAAVSAVSGKGDSNFAPNDVITRAETVKIIYAVVGKE